MEEMGMTDLQFKTYLKSLLRQLENAENQPTEEQRSEALKIVISDIKESLQG